MTLVARTRLLPKGQSNLSSRGLIKRKVKQLAKIIRKTRNAFSGSIVSSSTDGHQGASLSTSRIVELRRDALACAGINPGGRCRALVLVVA